MLDCHTHTELSPDSKAKLPDMCRAAKEKGLHALAVTDHIELCRWYPQDYYKARPRNEEDFYHYAARFERSMEQNLLAKETADGFVFMNGIEMGEPDADFALAERLYRDERLDLTIASLHELPGRLDFYFLDYAKEDIPALLGDYFAELLKIAEHDCYDVLGHITYPLRYIEGTAGIPVDMGGYRDRIAAIFKTVIGKGKGIELNTSGYRQSYGKPFPDRELLCLYKDLGGSILTLGSDAHAPEDVGSGITQGLALAKACGFDRVCCYLRHEPQFITI